MESVSVVNLKIVVDKELRVKYDKKLSHPQLIFNMLKNEIGDSDRECLAVLGLDSQNRINMISIIGIGTLQTAVTSPREIFKAAMLHNAHNIILVHNHPSGNVEPSKHDETLTKDIYEVGKIMKIPLLDHLIITSDEYYSFKECSNIL